jgi:hypothetical protein
MTLPRQWSTEAVCGERQTRVVKKNTSHAKPNNDEVLRTASEEDLLEVVRYVYGTRTDTDSVNSLITPVRILLMADGLEASEPARRTIKRAILVCLDEEEDGKTRIEKYIVCTPRHHLEANWMGHQCQRKKMVTIFKTWKKKIRRNISFSAGPTINHYFVYKEMRKIRKNKNKNKKYV